MKTLLVVAHPDDEAIIAGGTINKLVSRGDHVHVSYCTLNEEAYFGTETSQARAERTKLEAKNCAKKLKFTYSYLGFKDMHTEHDKGTLIKEIIKEIRSFKPDVIITHFAKDKHVDHRTVGSVTAEANFQSGCQLCGGNTVWSAKVVLQGEVDLEMSTPFNFQVVSELNEKNIIQKINGFKAYTSVKGEHKTSDKWLLTKLKTVAILRGKTVNAEYGEAFIVDDYVPLGTIGLETLAEIMAK